MAYGIPHIYRCGRTASLSPLTAELLAGRLLSCERTRPEAEDTDSLSAGKSYLKLEHGKYTGVTQ